MSCHSLYFYHHGPPQIAQSEAYGGSHQWVNYWLHTGHLHIKGLKMAKSLKNFITIRQALEVHTPRQLRFCFLLHKYNAPMDYGDGTLTQAVNIEKIFVEYFHNVKALLRRLGVAGPQHVGEREQKVLSEFESSKEAVRAALMDDFDTPRAIGVLTELIRVSNRYVEDSTAVISSIVVGSVARYVTSILRTLGLVQEAGNDIGFGTWGGSASAATADGAVSGASKEQVLTPLLDVLTKYREATRLAAIAGDMKAVLAAADMLRDDILPELGVR